MIPIDRLITIAQDINMVNEATQLCLIKERSSKENCEIIMPLVGEFSSGKTTLLNALTDSKQLETATKPTTSSIYEIHFGCNRCYAEIYDIDGNKKQVDNLSSLKNDGLEDSLVVNVFDTASRIPSSIILVDTPGLSSPDSRHKQTLVEFLPKADGILLVVDVNQQITRSLTDFITTMELAKRPVFLIITKCDTKAASELEATKKYIGENCKLPLNQIACISASTGEMEEFYQLLDSIQAEKGDILAQVNEQRVKGIVNIMLAHIDDMLNASSSDKELDNSIREKEMELRRIDRNIDLLLSSVQTDIEEEQRNINRKFEDTVFERMDAIVASKSENYDRESATAINSIASICLNEFKESVRNIIMRKAQTVSNSENAVKLESLREIDLSNLSFSNLSYNLDLNSIGHEYDSMIATGVKVAAAVGAVAVIAASAGAAAPAVGTAAAGAETAVEIGTAVEAVDIASDVGSIISNQKHISRVQQAMMYANLTNEQLDKVNNLDSNIGQKIGQKKGMIDGLVGFVTDKTWGKPQRRRAIRMYIDDTLLPQFKTAMSTNSQQVINHISTALHTEAEVTINEKKSALEQLRNQQKEQKAEFSKRLDTLRDYKNEILTH